MPSLNQRFLSLPPYPLAGMRALRREIEGRGVRVIDLGAGDATLDPPPSVVEKLREVAGDNAHSRYAFQSGLPEYREAIASFMQRRFGVRVDPTTEVLPLIGSKDGLAHLAFAYLEPGAAAVVPDPGYQAYLGSVILAGAEPYRVALRPEHDFLVPVDDISSDVAGRARVLYLNYPNNPTTAVAPDDYLARVVAWCAEHDVLLAYDNAYSEFGFDGYRPRSILEIDGARKVAVEFHSLSKTYNMTGWRIGWAVGDADAIAALTRVKTFMDTGPYLGIQAAAVAALESWEDWVPGNISVFESRRNVAVEALKGAGFTLESPRSTMYLWIPVPGEESAEDFAKRALQREGVVLLPGSALGDGGEGFFRVALTVDEGTLVEAADRLARVVS